MASIDAGTSGSDRADVYYSTPALLLHMRYGQLGDDEGAAEVDIDGVIPLVEIKVQDVAYSPPVPSVGYDYVGVLAMGFFDVVE
jgi:hypothetical protein